MLPKPYRLHQAHTIKHCFSGQRVSASSLIFFIKENKLDHGRLGVVVSKKVHKRSVVRHHLARMVRAFYQSSDWMERSFDIMVVVKFNREMDKASWMQVRRETWQKDWALLAKI